MTSPEFLTLMKSLGFTMHTAAEHFDVNRKTIQRWCTTHTPPADAVVELKRMWGDFADRVADVLDTAEALESQGQPVVLFAYRDELECRTFTGLSRDQHTALLGHCAMALTASDFDWEIRNKA